MTMVHYVDRGDDGKWVHRVFRGASNIYDFLDEEGRVLEDGWNIEDDPDSEVAIDEDGDPHLWLETTGPDDPFLVRDLYGRHGEAERERLQVALDHA